jgi:hypothetical protein
MTTDRLLEIKAIKIEDNNLKKRKSLVCGAKAAAIA